MTSAQIDYISVFQSLPMPALLLSPDFIMIDLNRAYERISGRSREELIGRPLFDAFPDNPTEPGVTSSGNLGASLRRAVASGQADAMAVLRYDVKVPGSSGDFAERYWCPVNVPVHGPGGELDCIIHAVEEVPELIRKFVDAEAASA